MQKAYSRAQVAVFVVLKGLGSLSMVSMCHVGTGRLFGVSSGTCE